MTKPLPFTQHSLQRAIAAARKSGLRITGICPDGTVMVEDGHAGSVVRAAASSENAIPMDQEDVWGSPKA